MSRGRRTKAEQLHVVTEHGLLGVEVTGCQYGNDIRGRGKIEGGSASREKRRGEERGGGET